MGSLLALPDPFDGGDGRRGLACTMTARGWLSTWFGLSSGAKLADTTHFLEGDRPEAIQHVADWLGARFLRRLRE
jgi:hypothetical protein